MVTIKTMHTDQIIDRLNGHSFKFLEMFGSQVIAVNHEDKTCTMEFNISTDFCHSVNVVQGGFTTAMLDAAMSHAVFANVEDIVNISSYEIKTTYTAPTLAGKLTAVGKIIKLGHKTGFMEAQLFNEEGLLTATASSVGKLIRKKT